MDTSTVLQPRFLCTLLLLVFIGMSGMQVQAQTLYEEDFDDVADGATSEGGSWATTCSGCNSNSFDVLSNEFEASDTDAQGTWSSVSFSVPSNGNLTISADLRSSTEGSSSFESSDFLNVCYTINAGATQCFYNETSGLNGSSSGTQSDVASTTIAVTAGQNVVIIIQAQNSEVAENYYWDNVLATLAPTGTGSISGTVYRDFVRNNAIDTGEGQEGITVALFTESCATVTTSDVPAALDITNASGVYTFGSLGSGDYCVDVPNTLPQGALITRLNGVTKAGFNSISRETVNLATNTSTATANAEYENPSDLCPGNSEYFSLDFDDLPVGVLTTPYTNGVVTLFSPQSGTNPLAIFNTESPTGGDTDLGTPNNGFGGPGVSSGDGGARDDAEEPFQNQTARGNVLISCVSGCSTPNDVAGFTTKIFQFAQDTDVLNIQFLDVDGGESNPLVFLYNVETPTLSCGSTAANATEACCDTNAECIQYTEGVECGDNCFQTIGINSFNLTNGPVRRLELAFPGSGAFAGLYFCSGTELPVELTSFTPQVDGRNVMLRWETASETNNAGFEVQQQTASGFETLAFLEGQGTTITPQRYSHLVTDVAPGRHVFRLRQVDFDGAFEYSPLVEVFVEMPTSYLIEAPYPNPFTSETYVRVGVQRTQAVRVELYTVTGRLIGTVFEGELGGDTVELVKVDGRSIPSGTYMLHVVGETFKETLPVTLVR